MIKKILNNNKGSALAMVIIIITILSTLGLAVMSLSLAHYKVGMMDKKAKLSFYMAESGLEQAYKVMLEEIGEAIKAGNEQVNTAIDDFLLAEAEKMENNEETKSDYVRNYYYIADEDRYIIEANWEQIRFDIKNIDDTTGENIWKTKTEIDLETKFQEGYKAYFNTTNAQNEYNFIAKIKEASEYKDPFDLDSLVSDNKPEVAVLNPPNPPTLFFTEDSDETSITLCSKYEKEEVPQKVQLTFTIQMPKDALKNYYIYQEVLKTNKTNALWNNAMTACGDIKIDATNVRINGNVYAYGVVPSLEEERKDPYSYGGFVLTGTDNVVSVNGDLVTHANVQINEANTSGIKVNGTVYANNLVINGAEENYIEIAKDLYTLDDIELNGKKSVLKVLGNYFGFSDGSTAVKHDKSSSIVINTTDINIPEGSKLSIGGEVFLLGTSYINVTEGPEEIEKLYQTGESLAMKGNYRAYNYYLPEYEYKHYKPMHLVYKKVGEAGSMSATDKAKFFYDFCTVTYPANEEDIKWDLIWGGVDNIQLGTPDSDIYTLGAYFNEGNVYQKGEGNLGEVETKKNDYQLLYNEKTDKFNPQAEKETGEYVNNLLEHVTIDSTSLVNVNAPSEYIFLSENEDVYLVGPGGSTVDIPLGSEVKEIDVSVNTCRGIIITKKDVHLRGNINFRGLIIAEGDIYIEDSQPKTIIGDRFYVRNKVIEWESALIDDPFEIGYPAEPVNETIESSMGVTEPTSVIPYKQYITIDMWEKV
ncbi:MAG: PilX N-terminal domain-containing pilus assembly protein [Peptococcia bacterium]|jgi:hypothetical protein